MSICTHILCLHRSTFQILFYALRPGFVRSQKPTIWHGINIATQLIFDSFLIVYFPTVLSSLDPLISGGLSVLGGGGIDLMGAAGAGLGVTGGEGTRMLIYFIMSSFWAGSLHPLAGHFIAEHYVWDGLDQETYSYYGWLNWFAYNVRSLLSLLHFLDTPHILSPLFDL